MLSKEDSLDFFGTLSHILDQTSVEYKYSDTIKSANLEQDEEEAQKENFDPKSAETEHNRLESVNKSLLKSSLFALMGNLCLDKILRTNFALDQSGILS